MLKIFNLFSIWLISTYAFTEKIYSEPLLEYRFNEDSSEQVSTGSLDALLTISGSAVEGADQSGVSGRLGDRAFDNSDAEGMGSLKTNWSFNGVAKDDVTRLPAMESMTITGWFNAEEIIGGGAYIFKSVPVSLRAYNKEDPTNKGILQLSVSGSTFPRSSLSDSLFITTGEWIFFAVTLEKSVVNYYQGDKGVKVELLNTVKSSILKTESGVGFSIGNTDYPENGPASRIFDGLLDNIRIYNKSLSIQDLEIIRLADILNEEPQFKN